MTKYARIQSGLVVELLTTAGDITTMFHPSIQWVDCTATPDVAPGWSYDGTSFAAPALPALDAVRAQRIAILRAACAAEITGGYPSSALGAVHSYPSTATDQTNMAGSVLASLLPGIAPDWTTPFWCADGDGVWTFAPHTAAQIQQAGQDGKAFVVAAQTKLKTLTASVQAAATADAVQAVVW